MTSTRTTSNSQPRAAAWRRHVIGIVTLVLSAGAVAFWFYPPGEHPWAKELQSGCWKLGPLMAVLWLAYGQLRLLPVWIWWSMPAILWALAFRPKALLVLIPLLVVLAILMPHRPARR